MGARDWRESVAIAQADCGCQGLTLSLQVESVQVEWVQGLS